VVWVSLLIWKGISEVDVSEHISEPLGGNSKCLFSEGVGVSCQEISEQEQELSS